MARKGVGKRLQKKGQAILIFKCEEIKEALAKELRTQVKDRQLLSRLIDSLGTEVAYGTGGGGGGVGVA